MTDERQIPSIEELAQAHVARERRVKRRTAFVIIVPAILGLALIAVAYAKQITLIEKRERSIADLGKTVDRLQNDNAALRATIHECDTKFQGQTKLLTELQRNAVARKTPDLATLRAVDLAVRESPAVQQSIAKTVRESAARRVSRIYLQIADEGQRDPARSVQDYLLSQGYNAPGIEKVGLKAPSDVTQVRYFVPGDGNAAARVVELLQSKYSIRGKPSYTRIKNPVPGQLEIWFTPDALKNLSVNQQ